MKKLFGQKPKVSRPSQSNAIPTPVPADQFSRSHPKDDWVVVQDSPAATAQDQSRVASFTSLLPGTVSSPPPPTTNNATRNEHYGNADRPANSSLRQNSISVLKTKPPSSMHGAAAILRSLDPDQSSLLRSISPSLESLPLTVETERDQRSADREYEAERERMRQREKERERERRKDRERQRDKGRDVHQDRDKRGDGDKPKEKEKKKGFFSSGRDKDKEREREAELTRMIGYLTATASEDWSLVLEVCERASRDESAARDASRALRREFKYAEPGAQLSAARLWAIMLRNCSDVFIVQVSSKKFLDTLEEVLLSGTTSPVVRERLLDVLAAAAYTHPGQGKDGYRALWKKVKPPNKPEEGIPFDENDIMLNPSSLPEQRNRRPSQPPVQPVIPADEDIRRLFEECEIGRGNARVLIQALTFARPEELGGPLISEWHRKCRNSQDFIMMQIPWATVQADISRKETRRLYLDELGQETGQIPTTREEELLAQLLGANEDLLEAFRIYDDLERLGVAEQEEREIEERSRRETKLDRTQIQFISIGGSFQLEETGGNFPGRSAGPSRSPSPSPSPANPPLFSASRPALPSTPYNNQLFNHNSLPHLGLTPPPPAPLGPRQAKSSRTPSPDLPTMPPSLTSRHEHSGSLGVDIKRLARMSFESTQDLVDRASSFSSEQISVVPSAKAMGKRKEVLDGSGDSDDPSNPNDFGDGRLSPFLNDDMVDNDDANRDVPVQRWKQKPMKFAYDAAAERAKELRRDLGIPSPLVNGKAY